MQRLPFRADDSGSDERGPYANIHTALAKWNDGTTASEQLDVDTHHEAVDQLCFSDLGIAKDDDLVQYFGRHDCGRPSCRGRARAVQQQSDARRVRWQRRRKTEQTNQRDWLATELALARKGRVVGVDHNDGLTGRGYLTSNKK
jgi:hypothetical protein